MPRTLLGKLLKKVFQDLSKLYLREFYLSLFAVRQPHSPQPSHRPNFQKTSLHSSRRSTKQTDSKLPNGGCRAGKFGGMREVWREKTPIRKGGLPPSKVFFSPALSPKQKPHPATKNVATGCGCFRTVPPDAFTHSLRLSEASGTLPARVKASQQRLFLCKHSDPAEHISPG